MAARLVAVARGAASAVAPVTVLGRTVLGLGVIAWFAGWQFGWREFDNLAAAAVVAIAAAILFTIGRDRVAVGLELQPARVVVGETAVGSVNARNVTRHRILPFRLEAPVGDSSVRADVPSLAAGEAHDELFLIPTARRSIVDVGPVSSVRGDPLGLARRAVVWTEARQLFVHPATTPLSGLTAGWIRDLEGRTTDDLSASDVAFHTLREYVPGDDRRHVHWRTSARIGTLMVRQFVDTRQSHLGIVVGTNALEYRDDDEFELAVSIAASLAVRAIRDKQTVSCVAGGTRLPSLSGSSLLDGFSGVERTDGPPLREVATAAVRAVANASVILLVTGRGASVDDCHLAAQCLPLQTRVIAVRALAGGNVAYRMAGSTSVLNVGELSSLEGVLRAAGS